MVGTAELPIQRAERGGHLCGVHRGAEERAALAAAFAAEALGAGDRLLYITADDGGGRERVGRTLEAAGLDVTRPLRTGQIVVTGFGTAYGGGMAAPFADMAAGFREQTARAGADGYPGLRIYAEMDGAPAFFGSFDALMRWELFCSRTVSDGGIVGLCDYPAMGLTSAELARVAEVHNAVAEDDGARPLARITTLDGGHGLGVAGEVDRSNAHALAEAIAARGRGRETIDLDLSELAFIDVAGVRTIGDVAARLPVRIRVVGMPPAGRRVVDLLGDGPPNVDLAPP
jgi:anti-anti-sigma regulatory factor